MKKKIICISLIMCSMIWSYTITAFAETEEQGLEEIRPLVEMAQVDEKEGMSLEEMTETFSDAAMSEYAESVSGFRMQYPSVFQFDEESDGNRALTADGKASLEITNHQGGLTEEALVESIRLLMPEAEPVKNEQNGTLRVDSMEEEGRTCRTDLYFLTEKSFHHVIIRFPSDEKEIYSPYIEYMINTMETNDTDLG